MTSIYNASYKDCRRDLLLMRISIPLLSYRVWRATSTMTQPLVELLKNNAWLTFWLTIAQTLGFAVIQLWWQFGIIDEMFVADEILDHIAAMTPTQKRMHLWTTATLDVAYPFTYGSFFGGMALRAFPNSGWILAIPSILCIPVDLMEGYTQVMLLSGHDEYVTWKTLLTPMKFVLFGIGLIVAIVGAIRLRKLKPDKDKDT